MTKQFDLKIEFTGICFYKWGTTGKGLTVLMPDARHKKGENPKHPDGTLAVPHVGYLRFDLRNLVPEIPGLVLEPLSERGIPSYEVVHRFQCEDLDLGLPSGERIAGTLALPDASEFAPVLRPIPGLDDAASPKQVLMRMRLIGGEFTTPTSSEEWVIRGDLRPDGKFSDLFLSGLVKWQRRLNGPGLLLRLSRFNGTNQIEIPLRPNLEDGRDVPSIRLKIANLCSNPLEWSELEEPTVAGPDVDFKWVYRLLERRSDADPARFPDFLCPVPEPRLDTDLNEGDLQDCFGVQAFP